MIRFSTLAGAALAVFITAGCDNAADQQRQASAAQAEANTKINAAQNAAEETAKAAQAAANTQIADAKADFMKLREEFRHSMASNLVDLDKKVSDLEAKAMTSKGKAKMQLDANLTAIRAYRAPFGTRLEGLEQATSTTWDAAKANVEKEWTELQALVDKA